MIKDMDDCPISEEDWKDTLAKLDKSKEMPNGRSGAEIGKAWGLKSTQTRTKLAELRKAGLVDVGWKYVRDLSGRPHRVPAYKIKKKE